MQDASALQTLSVLITINTPKQVIIKIGAKQYLPRTMRCEFGSECQTLDLPLKTATHFMMGLQHSGIVQSMDMIKP